MNKMNTTAIQNNNVAANEDVAITKELFVPIKEGVLNADKLSRPSLSYWKDARRRF